jgi:hypothetical protein
MIEFDELLEAFDSIVVRVEERLHVELIAPADAASVQQQIVELEPC